MANGSALLDPPKDTAATAAELYGDRNRARMQRDLSGAPVNVPFAGAQGAGGAANRGLPSGGIPQSTATASPDIANAPQSKWRAYLDAQRNLENRANKAIARQTQPEQSPDDDESKLKLRHYGFLIVVCAFQDLMPLVADLLGIGWALAYVTVIPVIAIYLYYVLARSPLRLKWTLLRGLFIGTAELIPVVGEILPGWTTLACYFYIMTSRDARTAPLRQGLEAAQGGKGGATGGTAKTGK